MRKLYCAFCKAYREAFGYTRPGHCYGCEHLNHSDDDKNEGEF